MKRIPQEYRDTPMSQLRLHPRNPRRGNVPRIGKSIEENGFFGAVVAQKSTGFILAGNHRYRAALAKHADSIPVLWVDVDDEQAVRILLVDNRANDWASYDQGELAGLLSELAVTDLSLEGTGYDQEELDRILDELIDPSAAAPDQSAALRDEGFQVLVRCDTEAVQLSLLERLSDEGFECRALVS